MPFKFFIVPIQDSGNAEAELNAFLRSKKILSVDRRWVEEGASSFWSFCVDFLEPSGSPQGGRFTLITRSTAWIFSAAGFFATTRS
jgi:hypothetical protein